MNRRSRVHMLSVAAARLESDYANPTLIRHLRDAAKAEADKIVEGRGYTTEDETRIERQRTLYAMLPSCNAADRLKASMMQRAYDLAWNGQCTECDALLEFLPSADAEKVLSAWENDQNPNNERTPFYEGA